VKFDYLSRDLWPTALAVAKHYKHRGYTVRAEKPILNDYGFHPTLTCKKSWELIAVEINSAPTVDGPFWDFVRMGLARRAEVAINIALPRERNGSEILLPLSFLDALRSFGVGLLLVNNIGVEEREKGARCSLVILSRRDEVSVSIGIRFQRP
jgi:hypothetical protein